MGEVMIDGKGNSKISPETFSKFVKNISLMRPTDFLGITVTLGVKLYEDNEVISEEEEVQELIKDKTAEEIRFILEEKFKSQKVRPVDKILEDILNKYRVLPRDQRRRLDKIVGDAAKKYQKNKTLRAQGNNMIQKDDVNEPN